jgi:hypothetical protein
MYPKAPHTRSRWYLIAAGVFLINPFFSAAAIAGSDTLGWLEWAWLEPGKVKIKTKLDTGAKTSSIHAVDIEEFERDGARWVRFRIPLKRRPDDSDHNRDLVLEREVERDAFIKDHRATSRKRYVVSMALCVGGDTFTTEVTLADRSRFNYPLLLGRMALAGRAVVDSARTFTTGHKCRKPVVD